MVSFTVWLIIGGHGPVAFLENTISSTGPLDPSVCVCVCVCVCARAHVCVFFCMITQKELDLGT